MSGTWQPLELPDGSYSDDTRPWSQQDVVGYLPTFAEMSGTRSRLKLVTVPGLNPFNVCGTGPHRGARNVEGKLFVVSGRTLFQVFTDGSVQERGTIPGTGRVSMTHNQVAGGNQLLIGTGSNSYVWDTSDNTLTANGVPLLSVDFLNQLCLGVDSQRRFWRYSGLADATDWNTLDNESAESSPDRIVGGIVSQGEWLVFGERTVEVWLNSPTDATAFQRGPVVEKGCANANTIQRLDNSVIWLGNDNIVYRMSGYTAVPISTKAMAASLAASSQAKAFAFTYEDRGYAIYYLTFQDGQTWGYDVTNQRWHRRHSMNLERWRLNTLVRWNGGWYGGDYTNGTLHNLEWGHALEGDDYLPRSFCSGVMHGDGNRVRVAAVKVLVDTGGDPGVSDEVIGLSGDAPDGYTGKPYSYTYTQHGGTAAYVYTTSSGALPAGVTIPSSSVPTISGTATTAGVSSFTMKVVDSDGLVAYLRDTISISQGWTRAVENDYASTWHAGAKVGDDTIIVGGGFAQLGKSTDRDNWTLFALSSSGLGTDKTALYGTNVAFTCIVHTGTSWVVGGTTGAIATSPTGLTSASWTARTSGFGSDSINAMAYGGGVLVAVGAAGTIASSSDDGATWALRTSGFGSSIIYAVCWTGSLFVAVGQAGKVSTSPDGTTWTASVISALSSQDLYGVATNGTRVVVSAMRGNYAHSTDLSSWTAGDWMGQPTTGGQPWSAVAFGGTGWVFSARRPEANGSRVYGANLALTAFVDQEINDLIANEVFSQSGATFYDGEKFYVLGGAASGDAAILYGPRIA